MFRMCKEIGTNSNLITHIRAGEKLYECSECGQKFSEHCDNNKHKCIHTEEKPYECSQCGKKFSQHSAPIKHRHIHLEKNHKNVQNVDINLVNLII